MIGTRFADYIKASGRVPQISKAGDMTCTRPQATRQILLAMRASSRHDPTRISADAVSARTRSLHDQAEGHYLAITRQTVDEK